MVAERQEIVALAKTRAKQFVGYGRLEQDREVRQWLIGGVGVFILNSPECVTGKKHFPAWAFGTARHGPSAERRVIGTLMVATTKEERV